MARAERVGKDIAGHVGLERTGVDRGRPSDVVRGARALLACHVDGKLGAGGTDVVLVVLAVGTPRPAGRVVHTGELATVGDRLPCVGRDGRGVGQRVTALREIAQVERGSLAVHGRGRRQSGAVELERGPVKHEVGANCVGQHDVRRLRGNVELNGPRHRIALGVNGTPLVARDVAVLEGERHDGGDARELDLNLVGIVTASRVQPHLEVDTKRDARGMLLEPLLGIGDIEHAVGDGPRRLVGTALVVKVGVANIRHRDVRREHVAQARGLRGEHALVDAARNLALHLRVRRDGLALPGLFTVIGDLDLHAVRRGVVDGHKRSVGIIGPRSSHGLLGAGALLARKGNGGLGHLLRAGSISRDTRKAGIGSRIARGVRVSTGIVGVASAVGCVVARRRRRARSTLVARCRRLICRISGIYLLGSNNLSGGGQPLCPCRRHPAGKVLEHEDYTEEQRENATPHRNRHWSTPPRTVFEPINKLLSPTFLATLGQHSSNSSSTKRQSCANVWQQPTYRIAIRGLHIGKLAQF